MKSKYHTIFNICSIIFLSSLVIFYGYRLIHFYILEHKTYTNEIVPFYEKLIDSKGIEGTNNGLQTANEGYYYASLSEDNYVYYLGKVWRIISIDKNNNIKMITEDNQTILNWDQSVNFDNSNINKWLNKSDDEYSGVFEKSLKSVTVMKQNGKISDLLTKEEYEKLGDKNYLDNGTIFWIKDGENYAYVSNGKVKNEETSELLGVRPTIVLASDVLYSSGSGKKEDPYYINNSGKEKISDLFVGEYVLFGGYTWQVIDSDDTSVGIALDKTLEYNGVYSENENNYSLYSGAGYYLNNDFFETIQFNNYIVEHPFYIGGYGAYGNYDFASKYENSISAKVGLLSIGDFYLNNDNNIYTLTPYGTTNKTIYVVDKENTLFADFATASYNLKPVIYVENDLFVISGKGTKEEPYEVGK